VELKIRQERPEDYQEVALLIEDAFKYDPFSDHQEHYLVSRLRQSKDFIAELSMVATLNDAVVGHILLTKITIDTEKESFISLALAPVSVAPNYQKRGIGASLIESAHTKAKALGFNSIVLLGHDSYYPKFGYELTSKYQIEFPFDIPEKYCMVKELTPNGLEGVHGIVSYPEEFY
tara:strand:+ start:712722 stop:713249 length:528 start_codon:yes stop_codon:yes gene_type:complete